MNETLTRALSGAVYVIILITATYFSVYSFLLLFSLFLLVAISEYCNLIKLKKTFPLLIGAIAFLLFYLNSKIKTYDLLLLLGTLFVSIKLLYFLFDKKKNKIDSYSKYVFLIGYIIFPFIIITKIPFENSQYNYKIIISIFMLIWANDTFAYLVGKSIGKTKLMESISPKKTIEGFLGGLTFTVITGVLISIFYINQPIILWIFISLIVSVFGTLGDLIESKFKRLANVKDSGNIMPGHGGVLDRLDSIIFVAPFVYLLYQILYYVS